MKKGKKIMLFAGISVAVIAVAVVLILVLGGGHRVIKVDDFEGEVTFERNAKEKDIAEGINLKSEDIITTGEDGLVELLVDSDKHILAQENTSFEIISKGNEKKGKLVIKLNYGTSLVEIENKLNDKSSVEVETPNTSLSVRGTTFEVSYSKENKTTLVEVTEGVVEITCGDETKKVREGQIATVTDEGAVVVHKDFLYNEVPVFKVGYMESGEFSDVYVKQLTEWQYEPGEVSGIDMNELVKDGIRIRYWIQSKESAEENTEYLEENDYLVSDDTYTNDDGDKVLTAISAVEVEEGVMSHTYRYYKEIEDGWCIALIIYSLEEPKAVGSKDVEYFLPLTNDCYYYFGLPEGVSMPAAPITLPEEAIFDAGEVDEDQLVSADEVPGLFRGGVTFEELHLAIRAGEYTRLRMNQKFLTNGLEILWYEPVWANVYAPIEGTERSYDINELNRLFACISDGIHPDTIPEMATIEGDVLTYEPCSEVQPDRVAVRITRIYFGEEDYLCVDYNFKQLLNEEGTSYKEGTTTAYFAEYEDEGKYRLSYIMNHNTREVYGE